MYHEEKENLKHFIKNTEPGYLNKSKYSNFIVWN